MQKYELIDFLEFFCVGFESGKNPVDVVLAILSLQNPPIKSSLEIFKAQIDQGKSLEEAFCALANDIHILIFNRAIMYILVCLRAKSALRPALSGIMDEMRIYTQTDMTKIPSHKLTPLPSGFFT